uniref:DNA-directed DNA polymerase n=1 Tax=viral metagenome TaxID=1070528 RepID=A0A6C0HZ07_9ZZZZ
MEKKVIKVGKHFRLVDIQVFDRETKSTTEKSDSTESTKKSKTKNFAIQMFAINEKGETASILVNNYQPFFYIRLPDNWDNSSYSSLIYQHFIEHRELQNIKSAIVSVSIVQKHKLYGFSAGKLHNFALVTFKTVEAMNRVKRLWYTFDENQQRRMKSYIISGKKLELYESNLPPILRYFHINNISPSGWVFLQTNLCSVLTDKTTTCKYEYECTMKAVKSAPEKETAVPYKICSFDIEASSSHGDFPIPVKSYKKLAANIVDIFIKQELVDLITKEKAEMLLRKIIMTGFDYDNFNDVDKVFPVSKPLKKQLQQMIDIFVKKTVDIGEISCKEDTIESAFERMKSAFSGDRDIADIDEGFDDIEDDTENAEVEVYEDYEDEICDEQDVKCEINKRKTQQQQVQKKQTVIDLLLANDINRDDKIQKLTASMGKSFPKLEGDKVTFIGSTFLRYGEKIPYRNHCVVLGSCDEIAGCDIDTVDDEADVLTKWTEIIQQEDPDIIIGYNIFGFDYEFMFRRAQETGCCDEFLKLSRNKDEICAKIVRESGEMEIENTKVVLASGEYDLRYFKMSGRIQIDMYSYFRRDFNLSSYKLDDVAGQFISDDIKYVVLDEENGKTRLYSQNLAGLCVDDFIHIEITGFSSDYYKDGRKFRVLAIETGVELEGDKKKYNVITIDGLQNINEESENKKIKWGMAKDDVSPQDIFRLSGGSSADRAVVAKYCIQDCNLVHHLMNKIDVVTGYIEMSRICSVPISFLVFRGQGIKLTSFVAKKCREKNTLMPDLEKASGDGGYEGAIVLPPKCAMYMDNPVACVDYSSLYPSSMISQNYSHDSKVWTKEYNLRGELIKTTGERDMSGNFIYDKLPGYDYIIIEFDTYEYRRPANKPKAAATKTKVGKMVCCWAQLPNNQKSIMPSILEELLKARSATRKESQKMEKTDPFMANILDKRQLGYKVTANSLYGQCGARTSTFYEKDVAACTTATGRMMIIYAKRIIEEVYGDRVYETACQGPVRCKAEYVYGDSVASFTPIRFAIGGETLVKTCLICEVAEKYGGNNWTKCEEPGKQTKEYCEIKDMEIWTEKGWTKVYRIIRHLLAPHKKMINIKTIEGSEVVVTDDHSLLNPLGKEITPKECNIGTELLACKIGEVPTKEIISYMSEIKYQGYVYDLTTENHHFAAGIGNIIVHNTDSVFFTFNLENPDSGEKIRGKPALEATIEIAQDAANLCTQFLKPPMGLAYEKTLMPFVLLSKKRYVGMLYEEDPNKCKLKYMGLVLKRRDNCDLVKDVYGGVLNILMKENNIQAAIDYLYKCLEDLTGGNVPMDKLTITKALRGYYKNPQQIAHCVLADRISKRDPGNKPKPGDRMKYVYINTDNKKALQGEKIETPEYIVANKLQINYTHYITNQLMKPLQQLFGLAVEQIWEQQNKRRAIREFKKSIEKLEKECAGDLELFMKKKEKVTSAEIKTLLFEKFLTKIYQTQNGLRTLTEFWVKK